MRKIALTNQKGGTGKTTTAVNLGACLAKLGEKVLLVDIDPQANASLHLGVDVYELELSIYHALIGKALARDVVIKSQTLVKPGIAGLEIAPANIDLSGAEIELAGEVGRETVLKDALGGIEEDYDYIFIDCPPSLGLLTLNGLTFAKEVFIPLQTEFFALEGMSKLLQTVDVVKRRLNRDLEITGIIPTLYDGRTRLSKEIVAKIRDYFGDKVFKTKIRENIRLAEAPSYGQPIITFAPNSHGAEDYMALAKEVLRSG